MKNVTEFFEKAIFSNTDWVTHAFNNVLDILYDSGVVISFWEGEENWASILVNDKTAGYIWRKYPLIVFEKDQLPNLKSLLKKNHLVNFLEVDSLENDLFEIDSEQILQLIDYDNYLSPFTMEDLWFKTNSI